MNSPAPFRDAAPDAPSAVPTAVLLRVALIVLASLLSVVFTKLALFAAVATLLGFVSLAASFGLKAARRAS